MTLLYTIGIVAFVGSLVYSMYATLKSFNKKTGVRH